MEQKRFKKLIALGVAGCLVLGTTVVALATETSGYEAYKDAVINSAVQPTDGGHVQVAVSLTDNNEELVKAVMSGETTDNDGHISTVNLNVKGVESVITTKYEDGVTSIACGDKEKVIYDEKTDDPDVVYTHEETTIDSNSNSFKLAEMLADTLVGDTKAHFVRSGDTVSLNLEGAQIPELAKLAVATSIEQFSSNDVDEYNTEEYPGDAEMQAAYDAMPQLTNINVTKIVMNADITDNKLNENDFTIVYTGKDASGVTHEVEAYFAIIF